MNFSLLWIDALLIALLWVAATLAITSRARRRWVRSLLLAIVIGPPLAALAWLLYAASMLKFINHTTPSWFGFSLSLLICFLIGAEPLYLKARRHQPGQLPAAANWSALPLVSILLIAIGVGYMAVLNMDLAIRARCAVLSLKAEQEYWAAAPAVVSEAQNAATLYDQAFSRLRADMGTDVNNPPVGNNDKFDPDEPATISFVHRQAKTIEMLREAAARPSCRFDSDIEGLPMNQLIPDLDLERHAANVLWLDSKESLAHGNVPQAVADTIAVKKMSRHFAQRPLLVCGLVGLGVDKAGNAMLAEVLPKVTQASQLEPLRLDELASLAKAYQQALRGEEHFELSFYASFRQWPASTRLGPDAIVAPSAAPLVIRVFFLDFDRFYGQMRRIEAAATQPYFQVRDSLFDLGFTSANSGLLVNLLPQAAHSLDSLANVEAGDACARVALAATRYRLDHGALPAKLEDLMPSYLGQIPLDPFDGNPLRLSTRNNHWIVYSIGPDRVDNQGQQTERKTWDLPMALK